MVWIGPLLAGIAAAVTCFCMIVVRPDDKISRIADYYFRLSPIDIDNFPDSLRKISELNEAKLLFDDSFCLREARDRASKNSVARNGETLKEAYFLLLVNRGPAPVEALEIEGPGHTPGRVSTWEVKTGVLICYKLRVSRWQSRLGKRVGKGHRIFSAG